MDHPNNNYRGQMRSRGFRGGQNDPMRGGQMRDPNGHMNGSPMRGPNGYMRSGPTRGYSGSFGDGQMIGHGDQIRDNGDQIRDNDYQLRGNCHQIRNHDGQMGGHVRGSERVVTQSLANVSIGDNPGSSNRAPRGRRRNRRPRRDGRQRGHSRGRQMNQNERGRVLQILEPVGATWILHVENLEAILLQPGIKDRHLVVISVVGKFRIGKSFLMSVLLNHMERAGENENWLQETPLILSGFEWKNSVDPVTAGILMWSKAFPVDLPTGEKVAVVLMDTQGTFDLDKSTQESAAIFALSTMISSVQIYNLQSQIGGDDLDHFKYFTEYGTLAQEQAQGQQQETDGTVLTPPFQHLHFLVRDWSKPSHFPLGADGGNAYLQSRIFSRRNGPDIKKIIDSCFSKTNCFLLPYPGAEIASAQIVNGVVNDMDTKFREHLADFVREILSPGNLVVKKIGGQPIKAPAFIECIKTYASLFSSSRLPEAESFYDLNANASYIAAVDAAVSTFHSKMDSAFGANAPSVAETIFRERSAEYACAARKIFEDHPKTGKTSERNDKFTQMLDEALTRISESKMSINQSKLTRDESKQSEMELRKKQVTAERESLTLLQSQAGNFENCLFDAIVELEGNCSDRSEEQTSASVREYLKKLKDHFITAPMSLTQRMHAFQEYVSKLSHELDSINKTLHRDRQRDEENSELERKLREAEERRRIAEDAAREAKYETVRANKRLAEAEARDREQRRQGWFNIALGITAGIVAVVAAVAAGITYIFVPGARPVLRRLVQEATPYAMPVILAAGALNMNQRQGQQRL